MRTRFFQHFFFLGLLCLAGQGTVFGEERDIAARMARYGAERLTLGDYGQAGREFSRLYSYFPESQAGEFGLLGITLAHALAVEDRAVLEDAWAYQKHFREGLFVNRVRLAALQAYLRLGDFSAGKDLLEGWKRENLIDDAYRQACTFYGFYFTEKLYQSRKFRLAGEWLRAPENAKLVQNAEAMAGWADRFKNLPRKSPVAAGFLAIIPGAGHLYAHRWSAALSSLLLNGIIGFATAHSLKQKDYGAATFFGIFGAGIYSGNIVSAINSAKHYNTCQEELLSSQFHDTFVPTLEVRYDFNSPFSIELSVRSGR